MRGFFIAIISGFLLSACASGDERDESRIFRYNESAGISSLDPAYARNLENMWACNQLFDGLVRLGDDMSIEPCLAESWEISEDGRIYTFTLREGVFFHSSAVFSPDSARECNAEDVRFSFERICAEATASPGKWVFDQVDLENNGFEVLDRYRFRIRLKEAFPPFLGLLTTQYANIVAPEAVRTFGPDFRENPVGTGPFKFAFWMEDVALVFHRHPQYWEKDASGAALPYLDAVKIDFIRDMGSEFQGLLQGKYDFMSGIHTAYKDELLDESGELRAAFDEVIRFQRTAFIKTDYVGFLVDDSIPLSAKSPLQDKRVRQAINHGIDRRKMVRYLRNNTVYPAEQGFIPRGLPPFDPEASYGYHYDPNLAAELLREAGYPGGEGLGELAVSTTSDYVDLMEFIQHNLSELGVKLSVNVLQSGPHREAVARSELLMFRKSWLADYADAENFLSLFYSGNFCPNGPNYTHYRSAEFDALFEEARRTVDPEDRLRLYASMDSLVTRDAPLIPLFYDQVSHFVRKEVSGLPTNPVNMLDLRLVRKN